MNILKENESTKSLEKDKIIQNAVLNFSVSFMLETNFETFANPNNHDLIRKETIKFVNKKLVKAGFEPLDLPKTEKTYK